MGKLIDRLRAWWNKYWLLALVMALMALAYEVGQISALIEVKQMLLNARSQSTPDILRSDD